MKLSGVELKTFREALREAFPAATKRLDLVVADADIGIEFAEFEGPYGKDAGNKQPDVVVQTTDFPPSQCRCSRSRCQARLACL